MLKKLLSAAAILASTTGLSRAQDFTTTIDPAGDALSEAVKWANSFEDRREVANLMGAYFQAMDRAIPRLRPAEVEWYQTEIASGDTMRILTAQSGREGRHAESLRIIGSCIKAAGQFEAYVEDFKSKPLNEAAYWAWTRDCWSKAIGSVEALQRAEILSYDRNWSHLEGQWAQLADKISNGFPRDVLVEQGHGFYEEP